MKWACVIALAFALCGFVARADEVPDDVGDSATDAGTVAVGAPAATYTIEWDADHDWFGFSARPWVTYTVTVATGTIYDCEVSLVAPAGYGVLAYTNTAAGTNAAATYISTSVAARAYVDVSGLAEFTTGTYTIAVSQSFVDTNTNGIPDSWETAHFGNLTNTASGDADHDGSDNWSEYLANTDPTNANSVLQLTQMVRITNATVLTWQTVPGGTYRIASSTYPGLSWGPTSTAAMATSTSASFSDGGSKTSTAYRVELIY